MYTNLLFVKRIWDREVLIAQPVLRKLRERPKVQLDIEINIKHNIILLFYFY